MTMDLFYHNHRGNKVSVILTDHARDRFVKRYNALFPAKPISVLESEILITDLFKQVSLVSKKTDKVKKRLKKHGSDTVYLRAREFTFVVQNHIVVTIEISAKGERSLNAQLPKVWAEREAK